MDRIYCFNIFVRGLVNRNYLNGVSKQAVRELFVNQRCIMMIELMSIDHDYFHHGYYENDINSLLY